MSNAQPTMRESIDEFLKLKEGKAPAYVADLKVTLDGLETKIGPIQMRHLKAEKIATALDKWAAQNRPSTYNKKLSHVRIWLTYAHQRRHTRIPPVLLLSMVEARRVLPRKRLYLTAEQLLSVLDLCHHPRDRAALALAMNTGLRISEICSLRYEDLDLPKGELSVVRHKTGTLDVMPVTADLENEMRRWLTFYSERVALQPDHFLIPAKAAPDPHHRRLEQQLAVTLHPTRPAQARAVRDRLRKILAGDGHDCHGEGMHTVRRSVARLAYDHLLTSGEARDEALGVVQSTLGHATQSMTERYIGVERKREKRDRVLKGQPFLSAMTADTANVRSIRGESAS